MKTLDCYRSCTRLYGEGKGLPSCSTCFIGSKASLQRNCNKEGFNVAGIHKAWSKARIGILGNNENDSSNCDSRIGFGTGGDHGDSNTCGNEASHGPDNGDQHIEAMGYILVQ